jgi:hypothetical protein
MDYRYAILMETNGGEYESWYNFIRYEGNEEALEHLEEQFKKLDFYVLDDLSTFDLELKRLVSEGTAREMCKVDVNAYMFHRKFDGKLEKIDFKFSKRDDNDTKIEKVNERIGMGDIDQYITEEDPCDTDFSLYSGSDSESDHSEHSDHSDHSDHSEHSEHSDHSDKSRDSDHQRKPRPKNVEEPLKRDEKKDDRKVKEEQPRKKEEDRKEVKEEQPRKKEEKKEDRKEVKEEQPRKKEEKKEDRKEVKEEQPRKKEEKKDDRNDIKNERDKKREKK